VGLAAEPSAARPLPDRGELEARWAALDARYAGAAVPRPAHWGGYRVEPDEIEVWQGRANRLHDRFRYARSPDGDWTHERLQP
jgi:pyridoxamine 5'-phosphate oxidase